MDKILHDPKDPKLWELWYRFCPLNRTTLLETLIFLNSGIFLGFLITVIGKYAPKP